MLSRILCRDPDSRDKMVPLWCSCFGYDYGFIRFTTGKNGHFSDRELIIPGFERKIGLCFSCCQLHLVIFIRQQSNKVEVEVEVEIDETNNKPATSNIQANPPASPPFR